ncbi:MAG: peptide chain release factor N(5)-glutamine methyltransferase [bacterium]|nr:peptide chain release factor N(5)-glutamine methyltransferase [bacterium]
MTIKESLQIGTKILNDKNVTLSSLDAEILLLYTLNKSKNKPKSFRNDRTWLYAHNDYALSKPQEIKFNSFIKRRGKFEPIAYIIGKKEFFGLEFHVDKNVLIPRPETEIMVEESLKEILVETAKMKKTTIVDIGTGSGAIAIAIAKSLKNAGQIENAKIYATDISSSALRIARKNAKNHNCEKNIIFKKGNLLKALPKNTKIDFLLANLPYVRKDYYKRLKNSGQSPEFYTIKYEPKNALLAGADGLKCFTDFFRQSPEYLAKNAKIYLESDPRQIPAIKNSAKKYLPKHKITVIKDLRGLNRIAKIKIDA